MSSDLPSSSFRVGGIELKSRLIVGTGKYKRRKRRSRRPVPIS
jgi:thiazole synthase ThiGH ThiG subunit